METTSNKSLEGGYTIERGSKIRGGTPPKNFQKIETPPLTETPKDVKKKKKAKKFDGRSPVVRKVFIQPKHRGVLDELEKNGGKITKAMIAMSYSKKYAETNSTGLRNSDSWQALMEEHLPQDKVAMRHAELLDKRSRRNIYDKNGKIIEYGVDDGPDTAAVTKAIEMAYKLRGVYSREEGQAKEATVTYNLFYKPGVQESMKAFEDQLIKQIYHEVDEDNTKDAIFTDSTIAEPEGPDNDRRDKEGADGGGGGEPEKSTG